MAPSHTAQQVGHRLELAMPRRTRTRSRPRPRPPGRAPRRSSAVTTLCIRAANDAIGSRLRQTSTSALSRYSSGSNIEWARNRYVMHSRNHGAPLPRIRSTASVAASLTAATSMPSTTSAPIRWTAAFLWIVGLGVRALERRAHARSGCSRTRTAPAASTAPPGSATRGTRPRPTAPSPKKHGRHARAPRSLSASAMPDRARQPAADDRVARRRTEARGRTGASSRRDPARSPSPCRTSRP